MTKTIKGLLVSAAAVFTACLFGLVYLSLALVHDRSAREDAVRHAGTLARVTFSSMFQVMVTGWSRRQLDDFVASLNLAVAEGPSRIQIFRGDLVTTLFGPIAQPPEDAPVREAMSTGRTVEILHDDEVRFVFPLRAEAVCLGCHTNAVVGETLGAIDVRQSVGVAIAANRDRFALIFLPAIPITFFATLLMVSFVDRRLGASIQSLGNDLAAINRVSDLRKLAHREPRLGFTEFNRIGREIRRLTERLRAVAVDRDMLECEIRLLEKFIITSEAVRDWRDYVSGLLVDINAVLPAYALFAIFHDEAGRAEAEVFWLHAPEEAVKARLEAVLRARLAARPAADGAPVARVAHHVTFPALALRDLSEAELREHARALLIEAPRIGGIVGVGVQADIQGDAAQLLVIEGALATLMNVVGSVKAIHRYTQELEFHATRDPLTQLHNQRVFWELLENEIARAKRHDERVALLVIDVDNFKSINDGHGHAFGDTYLQGLAGVIRAVTRGGDIVARYGGDEFVAILPATGLPDAMHVANRMLALAKHLDLTDPQGGTLACSVSIGLAVYPDHAADGKDLFVFADNMMYRAKADGRNRVAVPSGQDLPAQFRCAGALTLGLFNAIEQQRIEAHFQPIVRVADGVAVAVEVLARLREEDERLVVAADFVPLAEKAGLMYRIDLVVMRAALTHLAAARFDGEVFLNTSPRACVTPEFIPAVRRLAGEAGIAPGRLVFEITERETTHPTEQLDRFVASLKQEGFKFAVDDFGAGVASFHCVRRFPIDYLKIDGEFISHLPASDKDRALVRNIVALARELGIRTVAEHVESAPVLAQLSALGIDLAQGYHLGRPAPEPPRAVVAHAHDTAT